MPGWEVYKQLTEQFGDLQEFLANAKRGNVAPQISRQLVDFLSGLDKVLSLKLELAAIVHVGESFVKAIYVLKGDGPLVFSCIERLQTVANACQVPHFRNVHAVAVAIAAGYPTKNVAALEQETKRSVEPGIQWFLRKFNADLYNTLSAFKAARIMCPEAVQSLRPTPATAQGLRLFPFLDSNHVINGLITELPKYVAAAHNVTMAWRTK